MSRRDKGWWTETGRWVTAPLLDVPEPRPRHEWTDAVRRRYNWQRWAVVVIRIVVVVLCLMFDVDVPF